MNYRKILYIPIEAFLDTSGFDTYNKARALLDYEIEDSLLYQINRIRNHIRISIVLGDFEGSHQINWVSRKLNKNDSYPLYQKKVSTCWSDRIEPSPEGGYLIEYNNEKITNQFNSDEFRIFKIKDRDKLLSTLGVIETEVIKDKIEQGFRYFPELNKSIQRTLAVIDHGSYATDESEIASDLRRYTDSWPVAEELLAINACDTGLSKRSVEEIKEFFESSLKKKKTDRIMYEKEQERIDGFEWVGKSRLPGVSSDKAAKYYLTAIQTDDAYVHDIYFVNSSNTTLSCVVSEWLGKEEYEAIKAGSTPETVSPSWIYKNVEPYQGVKIASQDIIYDSDGIRQFQVSLFIAPNKVWKTAEVVNGTMGRDCVLLWEGDEIDEDRLVLLD